MKSFKLAVLRQGLHLRSCYAGLAGLTLGSTTSQKFSTTQKNPSGEKQYKRYQPQKGKFQQVNQHENPNPTNSGQDGNSSNIADVWDEDDARLASLLPIDIMPIDINADPSKVPVARRATEVFNRLRIHRPQPTISKYDPFGIGLAFKPVHEIHNYHQHHFLQDLDVLLDHWIAWYEKRAATESLWVNVASRPWGKDYIVKPIMQTTAVKRVKHAFVEVLARHGWDKTGRGLKGGKNEGKELFGTCFWRIGDAKKCCNVKYTELVDGLDTLFVKHSTVSSSSGKKAAAQANGRSTYGLDVRSVKDSGAVPRVEKATDAATSDRPGNREDGRRTVNTRLERQSRVHSPIERPRDEGRTPQEQNWPSRTNTDLDEFVRRPTRKQEASF